MTSEASPRMALLFPGQGAQYVGMGADLYQRSAGARAVFERADDTLGWALSRLCFEGPEERLNDTANTQPAIYTTTMALWAALEPRLDGLRPAIACAAGHSLGEFSALAAAGALSFEDGLRLVRIRGEAMRDAGARAPGGMAAIIGLDDEAVAQVAAEAGGQVWPANYNAPGQVVLAGEREALARAGDLAKERGASRVVPLAVSVPCHTPLMSAAAERLAAALEAAPLSAPWVDVVSNCDATPRRDPEAIKQALLRQLTSPVRWVASVQAMRDRGVSALLEVGPQAVVSALVRRIDRGLRLAAVTDAATMEALAPEELLA